MRSIVCSVDVDRPVGQVYDAWTLIDEFPSYMGAVVSVRQLDERSSHWVVAVTRERREFGAVVTEQVPDNRIAWESRGSPRHEGMVSFRALREGRTRLTVHLDWEPEGLFDRVGDRLGLVRRKVGQDLEAFKQRVESRPPAVGRRFTLGPFAGDGASPADDVVDGARLNVAGDTRGRTAERPSDIPAKGWVDVLKRTIQQLKSDSAQILAAGVAFYTFLAIIPALVALISIYGLVAEPSDVSRQLDDYFDALPSAAAQELETQMEEITKTEDAALGLSALISIVIALYSASKAMQSLVIALNLAYDEEETRTFVRLRLLALALTIAALVGAVVLVGGMGLVGAAADQLGRAGEIALSIIRWPVLGLILVFGLAGLYRVAPDRDNPAWRWATPGALLATLLWLVASIGFSVYANNFGTYNETYGALATPVVLLLWLFLTAYAIIVGAEMDSELERQTARDTTVGPDLPLGQRRAYAADTVAPVPQKKRASKAKR